MGAPEGKKYAFSGYNLREIIGHIDASAGVRFKQFDS